VRRGVAARIEFVLHHDKIFGGKPGAAALPVADGRDVLIVTERSDFGLAAERVHHLIERFEMSWRAVHASNMRALAKSQQQKDMTQNDLKRSKTI
jgi:hypothetical protein